MPKKLLSTMTFDYLEDENMYTRATLQADPNAADLLPMTDQVQPMIDETRGFDRDVRQKIANVDANRIVSNTYLDIECTSFGDDLYLACGKDRSSSRWTQFFKERVSQFIKIGLSDQVRRVLGWLSTSSDEVLEEHREGLSKWSTAADTALNDTAGLSGLRAQVWQRRESLASSMTNSRDNLYAALMQRAQERNLPRDWAESFFRVVRRSEGSTTEVPEEGAVTTEDG